MVQISEEKWKQIQNYFDYICRDRLLVCPNCGMPYIEGYICESCGADNSKYEINETVEDWTYCE